MIHDDSANVTRIAAFDNGFFAVAVIPRASFFACCVFVVNLLVALIIPRYKILVVAIIIALKGTTASDYVQLSFLVLTDSRGGGETTGIRVKRAA
jgi:hypothetical protein